MREVRRNEKTTLNPNLKDKSWADVARAGLVSPIRFNRRKTCRYVCIYTYVCIYIYMHTGTIYIYTHIYIDIHKHLCVRIISIDVGIGVKKDTQSFGSDVEAPLARCTNTAH